VKRWIPFTGLILTALITSIYFFLSGQTNDYRPLTSDPAVIYLEVCAECHGERGEGNGLLYPGLGQKEISRKDVIEIIREGAWLMPAFPQIPDTTLRKLSRYIKEKGFRAGKTSSE
jgi:mono/diheme cytochrome c family protein